VPIGVTDEDGPFLEPPPKIKRPVRWHLLALFALTLLAGVTRFVALDRPTIWYDEASTFRRVSGTFGQMLETIEDDPFDPIFYQAEWLVRQYHTLTPFWLRFIPALAGTLMVPAMYFLARQVAGRRTALATALFTLCSAWMINYARDAKMYMSFWLFVTLTAGCFLWWLRARTWTSYLAWVAAGCTMMGLNVWGGVILALSPLWMLTARRVHWAMGVGLVFGLLVICSGTVGYHQLFNSWGEKIERHGSMDDVGWVARRNYGQDALRLIRDSSSALLYKFTFIQEADGGPTLPPRRVLLAATIAIAAIAALLALGALPWRKADTPLPPTSPEPWWRPTLWLGSWLLVATYIFYCMSIKAPLSPMHWWIAIDDFFAEQPALFAIAGAVLALLLIRLPRAQNVLLWLLPITAIVLLALAIFHAYPSTAPSATTAPAIAATKDTWKRPIDALEYWLVLLTDARFVWPAVVIIGGVALARSGRTLRGRIGQLVIFACVVAGLVLLLQGVYLGSAAVIEHMKAQHVRPGSIWMPRYMGFIWPALAITVISLLMRLPGWPVRWTAVLLLCGLNLLISYDRVFGQSEPPIDRIVTDVTESALPNSTVRTYVQNAEPGGGPGNGAMGNLIGRYYLLNNRPDLQLSPDTIMREDYKGVPPINWFDGAAAIANDLKRLPRVRSVILWKPIWRQPPTERDQNILRPADDETDYILKRLGPGWRRVSDECVAVRYHWSWSEMYLYRRREYVRVSESASPPATRATTGQ